MGNLNPAILIITLNVNGLNTPIKEQRVSDWTFLKSKIKLYATFKK